MIKTYYLSTCVPTHKVIQNNNKYIAHNNLYDFLYSDSSSSQALTKQQSQSFLRSETPVENSIKGSGKIMFKVLVE